MKNNKNSGIEYMDRKKLDDLYSKSVRKYGGAFKALSEGDDDSEINSEEAKHGIDEPHKKIAKGKPSSPSFRTSANGKHLAKEE